jgi:hypothetical protein
MPTKHSPLFPPSGFDALHGPKMNVPVGPGPHYVDPLVQKPIFGRKHLHDLLIPTLKMEAQYISVTFRTFPHPQNVKTQEEAKFLIKYFHKNVNTH